MPNQCTNILEITGDFETLLLIAEGLMYDDHTIHFSKLLPIPDQKELDEMEMSADEWCEYNWSTYDYGSVLGSKFEKSKEHGQGLLSYHFHTAWTPCCAFVDNLSALYPKLNFELYFFEPLGGFKGYLICEAGEVLEYVCEDFDVSGGILSAFS